MSIKKFNDYTKETQNINEESSFHVNKSDKIIIAEFMGGVMVDYKETNVSKIKFGEGRMGYEKPYNAYSLSELKYTSSWDWLMPVVGKIHNLFVEESDIRTNGMAYSTTLHLDDHLSSANISGVYNEVVGFIKWYNENKTQENGNQEV